MIFGMASDLEQPPLLRLFYFPLQPIFKPLHVTFVFESNGVVNFLPFSQVHPSRLQPWRRHDRLPLPYAGTADMAKLTTKSNIGQPGKWAFKVSETQLEKPDSSLPIPSDKVNLPTGGPTTKFSCNLTAVIHGFQGNQDVDVYTGGVIAIGG